MKWTRGYGMKYNHAVRKKTSTKFGFTLTFYLCGSTTEFEKEYDPHKTKCPKCEEILKRVQ